MYHGHKDTHQMCTLHPLEDKMMLTTLLIIRHFSHQALGPDMPLITHALSSFPAIDWYNYDSALLWFVFFQLFSRSSYLLVFVPALVLFFVCACPLFSFPLPYIVSFHSMALCLCIFQTSPIWRWTVWTTYPRPWPVTSVSQKGLISRVWRAATYSMEQICWSQTPGTPSTAVNVSWFQAVPSVFLFSSWFSVLSFSLTDRLTIWLKVSLAVILAAFRHVILSVWSSHSFLTPTFVETTIPFIYLFLLDLKYSPPLLSFSSLLSSYDWPFPTGKRSSSLPLLSNLCGERFSHR